MLVLGWHEGCERWGDNEAARFHHACRWCGGGVAARGAGTGGGADLSPRRRGRCSTHCAVFCLDTEAMPRGRELQPRPGRRASPRAQRHSSINSGGDYARVPWLPVTFLVRADELCTGQHVALHCSLDLRFRRAS